jgi:hypothetical protein
LRQVAVEPRETARHHGTQLPPDVELALPPLDCTPPDDDWRPLFDEVLLDPFDALHDEPLDPVDPDELDPEPELDPVDVLELDEDLPVVAAWLDPGSTATTTPARATLARDTVVVVAFSRLRPCSRSATACSTWRAASRFACPGVGSSQLFTLSSVTRAAVKAVVELSANVLNVRRRRNARAGFARPPGAASI